MKSILFRGRYILPALLIGGFLLAGAGTAYAGFGERFHRGGMSGDRPHLVPEDMRAELKANFQSLTDEERAELRENRRETMEERRQEFEEFTGLSREEKKKLRQSGETIGDVLLDQGKTESDAEEFLTDRANERVDMIVERHNLDSDEERTIRERITEFVSSILDRWFGRS
jgi:hypothetical protein